MILEVLAETLQRTLLIALVILPLLFIVEWANHKYGDKLITFFERRKKYMPFWAALLSMLPGCNAAAAVALLYAKGLVSLGALLAAMIATSDEAVYVFLPLKFNFLPLFGAKFLLAVVSGLAIDFFVKKRAERYQAGEENVDYCCSIHEHARSTKDMFIHVAKHGAKIVFFVFAVLFAFNFIKDRYGFSVIAESIIANRSTQPIVAGLVGLLPGCGTSVVLSTLYTQGLLTFGGALSGLSVASGDTLVVLLSNGVPKKKVAKIIVVVLAVSVAAGYMATFL